MHTWPWPILVLLFRTFGILAPKKIYVSIRVTDFCLCLCNFQNRTVLMMLYIFVFHYFIQDIFIGRPQPQNLDYHRKPATIEPGLSTKTPSRESGLSTKAPQPQNLDYQRHIVLLVLLFWNERWLVFLIDICDTIDHHCWNFLFS